MNRKFEFNEVVLVDSRKENLRSIKGRKGVVRGKSQNEDNPTIYAYTVDIFDNKGEIEDGWFIFEEDLKSTGTFCNSEKFQTGETAKVRVDPKTGEGSLGD